MLIIKEDVLNSLTKMPHLTHIQPVLKGKYASSDSYPAGIEREIITFYIQVEAFKNVTYSILNVGTICSRCTTSGGLGLISHLIFIRI